MRLRVLGVLVLILLAADGTVNRTCCDAALRVGVLPFHVYSSEKMNYLQDEVPRRLAEQLARNKSIELVDSRDVQSALSSRAVGREWSKESLDQVARTVKADFLVYGSLTKIENALSLDASVFTIMPETGTFRSFVEGRDLDLLVKQIEGKISSHIMTAGAAKLAPSSETVVATASPAETVAPQQQIRPEPGPVEQPSPAVEEHAVAEPAAAPESAQEALPEPETAGDEPGQESAPAVNEPAPSGSSVPEEKSAVKVPVSRLPIRISSERMVADNPDHTVTFFGSVKAVKDDMVIHSDQMTTFYSEGQEVEKITAQGNVKISQKDLSASCQMATFLQGAQKIILTGKPKVWQGNNMVAGEKIEILLDQDKIMIEGGKKKEERVNVVIYPKEQKE